MHATPHLSTCGGCVCRDDQGSNALILTKQHAGAQEVLDKSVAVPPCCTLPGLLRLACCYTAPGSWTTSRLLCLRQGASAQPAAPQPVKLSKAAARKAAQVARAKVAREARSGVLASLAESAMPAEQVGNGLAAIVKCSVAVPAALPWGRLEVHDLPSVTTFDCPFTILLTVITFAGRRRCCKGRHSGGSGPPRNSVCAASCMRSAWESPCR